MLTLERRISDQKAIAYENAFFDAAVRGQTIDNEQRQSMEELKQEFQAMFQFDCEHDDIGKLQDILGRIHLNGAPLPFFQGNAPVNKEAAAAYAMFKIRQAVLYQKNPNAMDKQNHVVLVDATNRERSEGIYPELVSREKPEPPKELGRWKTFASNFGFYRSEVNAYKAEQKEYEIKKKQYDSFLIQVECQKRFEKRQENSSIETINLGDLLGAERWGSVKREIREKDPWWHTNSRKYRAFLKAVDEVNKKWSAETTPENARNLVKAYSKLEKACNDYIQSHSSLHVTDLGEHRLEQVRTILEMQKKERVTLQVYLEANTQRTNATSIGELVEETRVIPIAARSKDTVGAATSERNILQVENQKGIFTADRPHVQSRKEIIDNELDEMTKQIPFNKEKDTEKDTEKQKKDWEEQKKDWEKQKEQIKRLIAGGEWLERLYHRRTKEEFLDFFKATGLPEREKQKKDSGMMDSDDVQETDWEELAKRMEEAQICVEPTKESLEMFENFLEKQSDICYGRTLNTLQHMRSGFVASSYITSHETKEVIEYLGKRGIQDTHGHMTKLIENVKKPAKAFGVATDAQIDPERRTHLSERNIASSIMAELLGCPDVMAKSEKAKLVKEDGSVQEGMFMEFVEGVSDGEKLKEAKAADMGSILNDGHMKRQLADLQILDAICGQIDRHMGNVIFQTDPMTGAFSGMKAIDNDMAFGMSDVNCQGFQGVYLGMIDVVDERTAELIQNLDKEIIDYRLGHLLDERERNALWERVQTVQEWIKQDEVKKVPAEEWNQLSWQELAVGCRTNKFGKSKDSDRFRNIFYKAASRILPPKSIAPSDREQIRLKVERGKDFEKKVKEEREMQKERAKQEEVTIAPVRGGRAM